MDIQFYLLEEEIHITSFYEIQSNPFNVGDKICFIFGVIKNISTQ